MERLVTLVPQFNRSLVLNTALFSTNMKSPYLVFIAALMVATAARSEDVSATSVLGISYMNPSILLDDIVIPRVSDDEKIMDLPSSDLPDNDKNVDSRHDRSSRIVIWSSPG